MNEVHLKFPQSLMSIFLVSRRDLSKMQVPSWPTPGCPELDF